MNGEARRVFRRLYRAARTIAREMEGEARDQCAIDFGLDYSPSAIEVAPAQLGVEVCLLGWAFAEGVLPGHWTVAKANQFIHDASSAIAKRRWVELSEADVAEEEVEHG